MIRPGRRVRVEPGAYCAGERLLADCETAQTMLGEAMAEEHHIGLQGEYIWTTLVYLRRICMQCSLQCDIQLESINREPTGRVRFEFNQPET